MLATQKSALFNLAFACVGVNAKTAITLMIQDYWISAKITNLTL
jgi:hypothetical protein